MVGAGLDRHGGTSGPDKQRHPAVNRIRLVARNLLLIRRGGKGIVAAFIPSQWQLGFHFTDRERLVLALRQGVAP